MSRIIVKSLPKNITEQKLRSIFSEKGEITDIQLKYNNVGKFRCFAFIGFKDEQNAKDAKDYFDNTYIQTSKINIEFCKNIKSFDEKEDKKEIIKTVKAEFDELKKDPEFLEFLKVQRNVGDTKKIWSDDLVMNALAAKYLKEKKTDKDKKDDIIEESEMCKKKIPENIYKFTTAIRKIPQDLRNKKSIKDFFSPLKPISIRIPKIKCLAYVSFKNEKDLKLALDKHKSFMGNNQIHIQLLKAKDQDIKLEFNKNKMRIEKSVSIENIEDNGRLFVRNLNYNCTIEDLEKLFNKYGPTTEISLPIDTLTQKVKGFAFITYVFPEHAMKAFSELDRTTFQGRLLHIIPAESKNTFDYFSNQKSSFKKLKAEELKKESNKPNNWNTLFLGQNAIANILSKKMNINKTQFFENDVNKDSLAARMALGETQLVNETRLFLENNGVYLDSFENENIKRSKTTILIKHLPANTQEEDLYQFLSAYGKIKKLILPPSCITAILEMYTHQDAINLFKSLAYTKYKHIPLYLEWAPVNVLNKSIVIDVEKENENVKRFKKLEYVIDEKTVIEKNDLDIQNEKISLNQNSTVKNQNNNKNVNKNSNKIENDEKMEEEKEEEENEEEKIEEKVKKEEEEEEEEDEEEPENNTVIYVKNLNSTTNSNSIKQHFIKCGRIYKVSLINKKNNSNLSMGYGFVQYYRQKDAQKALRKLELSKLDGNLINLKLSNNPLTTINNSKKRKNQNVQDDKVSNKILVKNVPFEATTKDLSQLFSAFGTIQFVRLPKKLNGTGSHRGFAFVEFINKTDAKKAFASLSQSTHLYGRRLVLEWAKKDKSI